jgi:ATP-dependent DNA ligase
MLKPMLILNDEINIKEISYPQLASYKLDGLRLFVNGDLLSRSLKQIPNKQVREKFDFLKRFSIKYGVVLDGEIYCKEIPFQMISSCVMTDDYTNKKSIKAWEDLCVKHNITITREQALEYLKFYCFDSICDNCTGDSFSTRIGNYFRYSEELNSPYFVAVDQWEVNSPEEVEKLFLSATELGYEGLILKHENGEYKCGRTTFKENLGYKVKMFNTLDGKIIDVLQATEAKEGTERTINELGRSVTSKKLEDRQLVESASGFVVEYKGKPYAINLKMNAEEKQYVWKHRSEFIGKWVEYRCMEYGMKQDGLPRHGKTNQSFETIRMREDKD